MDLRGTTMTKAIPKATRGSDRLTAAGAKAAKPKEKQYKIADGKGLYVLVKPNGKKYWRMKYQFGGKEKSLAFGVYPEITLAEARDRRDDSRRLIRQDVDPMAERKEKKRVQVASANTFEKVANEWFDIHMANKSESHKDRTRRILDKDLIPRLGNSPIDQIEPPELLAALRRVETRGAVATAHKALQSSNQIFKYSKAAGLIKYNPASDMVGALTPMDIKHCASITEPEKVGPLMLAIDRYPASLTVAAALKFSALVPSRPGEIRTMQWADIDLNENVWMAEEVEGKSKNRYIVPLSRQALAILKDQRRISGDGKYVFPSIRTADRPMSENTITAALRATGYTKEQMTAHGFRAMFRTIGDEILGYPADWLEHQFGHAVRDANGRAYNRTRNIDQRREMMQSWADYLDHLKTQAAKRKEITRSTGKNEFAFGQ